MTPRTPNTPRRDDDLATREWRICDRILDGIEATLDELAQPGAIHAALVLPAQESGAPLLCRRATCRRAQRCRGRPCALQTMAATARPAPMP